MNSQKSPRNRMMSVLSNSDIEMITHTLSYTVQYILIYSVREQRKPSNIPRYALTHDYIAWSTRKSKEIIAIVLLVQTF